MKSERAENSGFYRRRCGKYFSLVACLVFFVYLPVNLPAQETGALARARQFEKQAGEALEAKDFAAYLANVRQAAELRPNHPRLLYHLARAYALSGEPQPAVRLLERLAKMGMLTRLETDEELKKQLPASDLQNLKTLFERNRQPLNTSSRAFTLAEKDLITEGVAYDSISGRFFVSSVRQRKILAVAPDGKTSEFSSPRDNLWSVLGMKTDEKRRLLWVSTTAFPQMLGFKKTDEGASAIFKYDLTSGRLLKKYVLASASGRHGLGDLVVARNGDVWATDSVSPAIYRINPTRDEIEPFLVDKSFVSLQGLTFTPDEKHLFVADYSQGIFSVEMATKKIKWLAPAGEVVALGVDGLYFHQGKLIGVQNGTNPQRVVRFSLSKDYLRLTAAETLEANHADFNEPTLGVLVGRDFYFVANSQYEMVDEKGEAGAPEKWREPVVLRLRL
jgi:sugar lactone lactonase YvrE